MKRLVFLLIFVMLFALTGCGGGPSITTSDGDKVAVNKDGISVESEDGTKTEIDVSDAKKGSLPKEYPSDILPVIDDAEIVGSMKSTQDGKQSHMVSITSEKSYDDVVAFYEDQLSGYENFSSMDLGDAYTCGGVKDGYTVSVIINQEEPVPVQLMVTQE